MRRQAALPIDVHPERPRPLPHDRITEVASVSVLYRRREATSEVDAHAPLLAFEMPVGHDASLGLCGSSNVSSLAGEPTKPC